MIHYQLIITVFTASEDCSLLVLQKLFLDSVRQTVAQNVRFKTPDALRSFMPLFKQFFLTINLYNSCGCVRRDDICMIKIIKLLWRSLMICISLYSMIALLLCETSF